jgi:large subunit ribosomal protein L13
MGDNVVVINAANITVTGNKLSVKHYYHHSNYPGGMKSISLRDQLAQHPDRVIRAAVWGMLPHNKMGRETLKRLKIYSGTEHPHGAQVA